MPMVIITAEVQDPVKWEGKHPDARRPVPELCPSRTGPFHDGRERSRSLL